MLPHGPDRRGVRAGEPGRAEAAQARGHHGLHVRDPLPAAGHRLRRRARRSCRRTTATTAASCRSTSTRTVRSRAGERRHARRHPRPEPGAAGSPRPKATRTSRSRTCRWASSARPAAGRAQGSPSATRSSTSPPSPPACSLARRNGSRGRGRSDAQRPAGAGRRPAPGPAGSAVAAPGRRRAGASCGRAAAASGGGLHRCTCRRRSATTPTSMSASTTRPMSASCSAPTTRSCRTTNGCRSAITAGPRRCCPSGAPVRRPNGQRKRPDETEPSFGPCRNLDYELELGRLDRPRQRAGQPDPDRRAAEHVAGYCLLNDWSARDIQAWEYQPLGPFLAKNFATTVSPWIVTPEALAPFRTAQPPRPEGDPGAAALPAGRGRPAPRRLRDRARGAAADRAHARRRRGPAPALASAARAHMYWTVAQMVAHHTSNGCSLAPGRSARLRHHLGARPATAMAACSRSPPAARSRSPCRAARPAPSSRTATRSSCAARRQRRGCGHHRLWRMPGASCCRRSTGGIE